MAASSFEGEREMNSTRRGLMFGTAALLAAPAVQAQAPTKVAFQLSWIRSIQYGGLFAAQELGYFREVGIEPEWQPGGPNIDAVATVAAGRALIGDRPSDQLIIARGRGIPVKMIGAMFNRSPSAIMSLTRAPIRSLADMVGKTVAIPGGARPVVINLMRNAGLDANRVTFVPVGTDPGLLASGQVDGYVGLSTNQGVMLQARGVAVEFLHLSDVGSALYGGAIYVTDTVLAQQRALLVRFLRAAVRGHQKMIDDPELVARWTVEKYAAPGLDLNAQTIEARASIPYIKGGEAATNGLLWVDPDYVAPSVTMAVQTGVAPRAFPVSELVDQTLIREVHGRAA
jgi:ABC-type nitrate/sulfonate/bicarbonate transport system substrate-binding protein